MGRRREKRRRERRGRSGGGESGGGGGGAVWEPSPLEMEGDGEKGDGRCGLGEEEGEKKLVEGKMGISK